MILNVMLTVHADNINSVFTKGNSLPLRSQFALNFLDPSFIPLTHALNEELQGKPSKWTFNRTAFYQQRYYDYVGFL
jgi:hypothetical protein